MRILGLLAVLLLATACTVTRTGGPVAEPPAPPSAPSVPPVPSSSQPPTYQDSLADCSDAACSVTIPGRADIPLERGFGFTDFVVTFVPPETVLFEGADPVNGDVHGNLSGTGYMSLNGIMITVDGYGPAGARLVFEPPK